MNKQDKMLMIKDMLEEHNCLIPDGYDNAIIGISQCSTPKAVYDTNKCIKILIERDKMSEQEALEYFEFNVLQSYVGEKTPIFILPII